MTARLPGPGPQLSSGRIRVDAKRAIAKLREYQLTDRTHWILEAIRAAVASGAKHISLSGDANDIWLTWEGPPWDVELLPRLFDELVSPAAGGESQHVRLLAAAVNSALGMNPAYIDVMRVDVTSAQVARYKPDVLAETDDLEESPLEKMVVETVKRPAKAPVGMHLHLRRRVTLDMIAHFLTRPPEITVAEAACRDIAVPLKLPDCEMHRDTSPDVLRLPLGEGVDGFIAVTEYAAGEPQLIVAEHGVVLARYPFDLVEDIDTGRTANLPVRVFVDAPRMPTNASRSQVRRDKHPISTAEKTAKKLVPAVIQKLGELVKDGDERARKAALDWIAGRVSGPQWYLNVADLRGPLREIAKLALVRNALGEPRGLAKHWLQEIHTGKTPVPSELAKWLADMMWIPPGDPASALLNRAKVDERASRRLVRWASRQAAAEYKFYSHAKREAKVVAVRKPRIRARLGADVPGSVIDQARFADLAGEICVYSEGLGGSVVVLLEGRELERISIGTSVPFEAVVDSSRVKPADRYRGVERDGEYAKVERAVNAGVIRAIEALTFESLPKGYTLEADATRDDDARLFRQAFGQLREQKQKIRGPLAKAACWPTTDGRWVGVDDLTGDVGAVSSARFVAPKDRVIVIASAEERQLLGELASGKLINYDRAGEGIALEPKIYATVLANELANGRPCSLAITEGDLVGAIAPSTKATVQLRHAGVKLQTQSRKKPRYVPSAIIVSSDAIVPDTDWKKAHHDAGLLARDYGAWELALLRAMARAVAGELRPELRVPGVLTIDGPMGTALCEALVEGDPQTLLGDNELIDALRKVKIVKILGQRERITIDELLALYPGEKQPIPLIVNDLQAVTGFSPMHAPLVVGQAIAKLAGRKSYDASSELLRRQRRQLFEQHYAEHCAGPENKEPLPSPHRVDVIGSNARGQIGLGGTASWVRVFVENRKFAELHVPFELPVVANLDAGADQCNETFDEIPVAAASKMLGDTMRAVPRLLLEVGRAKPEQLADVGPARRLLVWASGELDDQTRAELCTVPAFKTVQRKRVSLETAWSPHQTLRKAAWKDEWLGPDKGESESSLDEPILAMADEDVELTAVLDKLPRKPIVDVTDEVVALQANRRMARGLIPTPKVNGVAPELKRSLADLGENGKKLGHGELALLDADESQTLLHVQGKLVRTMPLVVQPPVALAIEEHELGKLRDIGDLVTELVSQVLASPVRETLTPRMLHNLARAVWARRISPKVLGDLDVFATVDQTWIPWAKVVEQSNLFGDVWTVNSWTDDRPLDARRIVLLATKDDIRNTSQHNVKLIDAREELRLDALAKRNRARPRATSLALPSRLGLLAEAELEGDGTTSPRGSVAILIPSILGNRGVHVLRDMQPIGMMTDPCAWPTMAVLDDARLTPDRTWAAPKTDQIWQADAKLIRQASEQLLDTFGEAPTEAIVSVRIDAEASSAIAELRSGKSQVRGLAWLTGTPLDEQTIQLTHNVGVTTVRDQPVSAELLLYVDGTLDKEDALEQFASFAHGKLVRKLVLDRPDIDDLVRAHVAHALALGHVKHTEVRGVEFACFVPKPLEPRALVGLLRRQHRVWVVDPGESHGTEDTLVDDGSLVANVLKHHFGDRLRRAAAVVAPSPAAPQPVTLVEEPKPEPKPAKPVPAPKAPPPKRKAEPHPIQGLVEQISKRVAELGLRGYEFKIAQSEKSPMFQFSYGYLFVAGNNERLRSLALLAGTESAWLPAAIDALAAHVVSVLNIALTDVTDSAEVDALQLLLSPRSAGRPQSRRSS